MRAALAGSICSRFLIFNVPFNGSLFSGIQLTNPVALGQTVIATFNYTVDPASPDGVSATATSNSFTTTVFRNNYLQQINDLIQSVALEAAALANISNAEGAKIQAMVARNGITSQELLCVNKSVREMMDAITLLQSIPKMKLNVVDCQINGTGTCS